MGQLSYSRHFLLLTGFTVSLGAVSFAHPPVGFAFTVALYGGLHATALVLALRKRAPLWRKSLFVAAAAGLCVLAVRTAVYVGQLSVMPGGDARFYWIAGDSAVLGAASYGILVGRLQFSRLAAWDLVIIAVGCLLATSAALFVLTRAHIQSPWVLAAAWWYAFSAGLWHFDRRSRVQGPTGELTCSGRTPSPRN